MDFILMLRSLSFTTLFIIFSLLEHYLPSHKLVQPFQHRLNNCLLGFLNQCLIKLMPMFAGVSAANFALQHQIGLFHLINISSTLAFLLSLVLLDLAIYGQHRLMHHSSILWQIHQVHHTDPQLNASSGLRFHPLEAILSMLYRSLLILLLAIPSNAVILFEIILNGMSMFNHSNIKLSPTFDNKLRKIIVTPSMHQIHHTISSQDQKHNYSFNLSLWDYCFNSYQFSSNQKKLGIAGLKINTRSVLLLLSLPFQRRKAYE